MRDLFAKVRPQILLFGFLLGVIALYGLRLDAIEVVTGCVGALTAIGMKILEDKD
tara:strand:- start:441 stop:605 length:165 start_codon:yes stop_codon:yes gene_type:complete